MRHFSILLVFICIFFIAGSCDKEETEVFKDPVTGTFTDYRDGTVYKTVTLGNQTWMAENLKYLPSVVGPDMGAPGIRYYYVYGYNGTSVEEAKATANYQTYGVLYNWSSAINTAIYEPVKPQGVCPAGWHLPSDEEWEELSVYLGGAAVSGGKLKESGTTHWRAPNEGATDISGFSALPGGIRSQNGGFGHLEYSGFWWTSYSSAQLAWYRSMSYTGKNLTSLGDSKGFGLSVRCIKN